MDYGKPFTFMFEDRDWVAKILIGALFVLLSVVLIGIPFVLGYMLEVVRRVAAGREDVLPPWDDLGDKFVQGLILLVILFIFYLPATLLTSCSNVFFSTLDQATSNASTALVWLLQTLVNLVALLYALLILALIPAIAIRYAMTRDFGAAFNLGALWDIINANLGAYALIVLLGWVAFFIIGSLGVIVCVIGVFVTAFWSTLVMGHLYGQYHRNFLAGAPPTPIEPSAPAF